MASGESQTTPRQAGNRDTNQENDAGTVTPTGKMFHASQQRKTPRRPFGRLPRHMESSNDLIVGIEQRPFDTHSDMPASLR